MHQRWTKTFQVRLLKIHYLIFNYFIFIFRCTNCNESLKYSTFTTHLYPTLKCAEKNQSHSVVDKSKIKVKSIHKLTINRHQPKEIESNDDDHLDDDGILMRDDDVVDNRHSLPRTVKTKNGFQCTYCRRKFRYQIFFELHLCSKGVKAIYK